LKQKFQKKQMTNQKTQEKWYATYALPSCKNGVSQYHKLHIAYGLPSILQ
jgi:hypothetical protein